jgi:alpha-L-fucosidase
VRESAWKNGEGDVLKDLSEACAEYGLGLGIYISPWDRFDPHYGTPEYNRVFEETLRSALGGYGPVFEQWFDGACGEGPNGKRQEYDWPLYYKTVFDLQPDAIVFSDVGPGCRWVGNERGVAGRTSWSTYETANFVPGIDSPKREAKNEGIRGGSLWVPSESDVSIRPGWFWRESENDQVKSLQDLLGIYYTSVGRNSLLLLNVPPDTRGRIHEADSARLMEWRGALDRIFSVNLAEGGKVEATARRGKAFAEGALLEEDYHRYWAVPDDVLTPGFTLTLPEPRTFNRIVLQEYIPLGQRVAAFEVEVFRNGAWEKVAQETTIGYKRILLIPTVTASAVRVRITEADACPVLNRIALYQDDIYQL